MKLCKKVGGSWETSDHDGGRIDESVMGGCRIAVTVDDGGSFRAYRTSAAGKVENFMNGLMEGVSASSVCAYVDRHVSNRKVRDVMNRIGRVNVEQAFMDEARLDESPECGLFWVDVDDGRVYGDGMPIRDCEDYGEYVIHPGSHYELWKKVRSSNRKWKDVRDYEDVPRGRVIFSKDRDNRHFIVYMSPVLNDRKYENAVKSYFGLPSNTVFDYGDPHYVPVEF